MGKPRKRVIAILEGRDPGSGGRQGVALQATRI